MRAEDLVIAGIDDPTVEPPACEDLLAAPRG